MVEKGSEVGAHILSGAVMEEKWYVIDAKDSTVAHGSPQVFAPDPDDLVKLLKERNAQQEGDPRIESLSEGARGEQSREEENERHATESS